MKKYLILIPLSLSIILIIYLTISYNIFFNNFKSAFNNNNFNYANSLLITSNNFNPFKTYCLSTDLKSYFEEVLSETNTKLKNKTISKNEYKNIIIEISSYDFVDIDTETLLDEIDYEDPYYLGKKQFDAKQYIDAYNTFMSVHPSNKNYSNSIIFINKCQSFIKNNVFSEADSLCANNYYTKAIALINSYNYILDDDDINKKIASINTEKEKYLSIQNKSYATSNSNITEELSPENINSKSITSNTNYLLNVNINEQKLYVYKKTINSWLLCKTIICSTGIVGEETPLGVYSIQNKGEWFFSEKYQQGGKYWIQFWDNYLFHSVPFDETQKNILDYTLGKPSSHGCIRLSVEDSKWLYDNIPINSKVIIK